MKCRNAAANSGPCRPDSMARDVFQTDQVQPIRRIVRGAKQRAAGVFNIRLGACFKISGRSPNESSQTAAILTTDLVNVELAL